MNKRGQGLSLTTIVVAAIALLVLVILSVIFIGRMTAFSIESSACKNAGGKCLVSCSGTRPTAVPFSCVNNPDTDENEALYSCCVAIS